MPRRLPTQFSCLMRQYPCHAAGKVLKKSMDMLGIEKKQWVKEGSVFLCFALFVFFYQYFGYGAISRTANLVSVYDVDIYHLIGRGWMNGLLPYRDLSDLKGPLVFLEYGIGSVVTPFSFLGVCVIHSFVIAIGFFYAYKTATLFVGKFPSMALSCIYLSWIFAFDGAPSEVIWCLEHMTIYWVLARMTRGGLRYRVRHLLSVGACAGAALLLKFNYSAFWIPLFLLILVQDRKSFWRSSLWLASGVFLVVVPFLIYFWAAGGLGDLWNEYVMTAVTYGQGSLGESALLNMGIKHFCLLAHPIVHGKFYWGLIPGILLVSVWALPGALPLGKGARCFFIASFLLDFVICMKGERCYSHYYVPFYVFDFLSLVAICLFACRHMRSIYLMRLLFALACFVPFAVCGRAVMVSLSSKDRSHDEEKARQSLCMMAAMLRGKTVVVYESYHVGLYRIAGALPPIRHFIARLVPSGKEEQIGEMVSCLASDTPPQYIVALKKQEKEVEKLILDAGTPYRQVDLIEKGFPALPPDGWCTFILYEYAGEGKP